MPASRKLLLGGPKLKVERAKCHIKELRTAIDAFHASNPYTLVENVHPKTGENVIRLKVEKAIPPKISVIIGDIVHNLRASLDQLICALVKANFKQSTRGTGFPVSSTVEHFKSNSVGKIKGVSAKAERFIHRLKPYERGCKTLWILHELDVIDKHTGIIAVGAAHIATTLDVGIPIVGVGNGQFTIGAVLPGQRAVFTERVVGPRILSPLKDGMEVLRAPANLQADVEMTTNIAFGQRQVTEGEPVVETLIQIADLIQRILDVAERRL